jgi:hypothetical protein
MPRSPLVAAIFLAATVLTSCAARVTYRTYDPYYRDYHVWGYAETPYYNQWVIETRRPHREYQRLPRHDREAYWRWRHDHR